MFSTIKTSPHYFSLLRIAIGLYLICFFIGLAPYSEELLSSTGLPSQLSKQTKFFFPWAFAISSSFEWVLFFIVLSTLFALALSLGVYRRFSALFLWYSLASIYNQQVGLANPSFPFLGWLLLALSVMESGEPWSLLPKSSAVKSWNYPRTLVVGAWLIAGVAYTLSGIHKLRAEGWLSGEALHFALDLPYSRDNLFDHIFLALPLWLQKVKCWIILGAELLFLPCIFFDRLRPLIWLVVFFMHVGLLFMFNFWDLSSAMILFHFFLFDSSWISPRTTSSQSIHVFVDGYCLLCNGLAKFILMEDTNEVFKLDALQSVQAKQAISNDILHEQNTIVVFREGKQYTEAEAVFVILDHLGGLWRLFTIFRLLPKTITKLIYRLVARTRYYVFGRTVECRLEY